MLSALRRWRIFRTYLTFRKCTEEILIVYFNEWVEKFDKLQKTSGVNERLRNKR